MRSRKQEGIGKRSPQEPLAPPLQAWGGSFATEKKSTGGYIYVWDFCIAILTDPVHHTTQMHLNFIFRNSRIGTHFTLNFLLDCICTYLSEKSELPHLSLPEGTKNINAD